MELFNTLSMFSVSGIFTMLGAVALGFVVFHKTKSAIYGSLVIFAYLALSMDFLTTVNYLKVLPVIMMGFGINLVIALLVANLIFAIFKQISSQKAKPKKCCSSKHANSQYPKVVTKNKFNKRSLYRLSK